jgi:hypothetical protein
MNGNNFMLSAMMAAVAAVEGEEDNGEAVVAAVTPAGGAGRRRKTGGGSLSAPSGSFSNANLNVNTGSTHSSLKSQAAQSQRAWRQKSGIFDASTFRIATGESPSGSRDSTPTNAGRRSASPSPKNRLSGPSPKSRTPTFRRLNSNNQGVTFDFDADDQQQQEQAEDVVIREEEEADMAEEEEDEEDAEAVGGGGDRVGLIPQRSGEASGDKFSPWGRHISINPWYLSHQQGAPSTPPEPLSAPTSKPAAAAVVAVTKAPPPLSRQRSYRTETIVEDIFEREAVGVAFAVMSRRDAERASKDETLARSNKHHIRRSVEMRAAKFQQAAES